MALKKKPSPPKETIRKRIGPNVNEKRSAVKQTTASRKKSAAANQARESTSKKKTSSTKKQVTVKKAAAKKRVSFKAAAPTPAGKKATVKKSSSSTPNVEDQLKRSEEEYRALFENMLNAIALLRAIYDEQGNPVDFEYLEVNKNFERIFGLKPSDVIGKRIHELVPEERIMPQIQKFCSVVTAGEPVEFEWFSKSVNRWHMFSAYRSKKDQLVVLIDDITERKKMEDGLRKSIDEKNTLIKEINHRVKNNFLTIYSLLRFQANQFKDKKLQDAFLDSQNRVHIMSLIHDRLSKKDDGKSVSAKDFIEPLALQLFDSYCIGEKPVSHLLEIDDILLGIDTAIPIGLIINELISNSFKHGLNQVEHAELNLKVKSHKDGLCSITIRDNGKGLPEDFDIEKPKSLGFELVKTLVDQLDGKILVKRDGGTTFIIEFMAPQYCV